MEKAKKKKQITTNVGYFLTRTLIRPICQNVTAPVKTQIRACKKEQLVSFVGAFEEHFAVTLSTVSPLAKEMPFTGTLKIIKHIMDITVTLRLVCSFV